MEKSKTLVNESKKILKELIKQCTEKQQHNFKLMYSHKNLELSIEEAIDNMDESKMDWACTQIERTIASNLKKQSTTTL